MAQNGLLTIRIVIYNVLLISYSWLTCFTFYELILTLQMISLHLSLLNLPLYEVEKNLVPTTED